MKKLLLLPALFFAFTIAANAQVSNTLAPDEKVGGAVPADTRTGAVAAQVPTKAFDVRIGNGIVDGGVVQPFAVYIVFKDSAIQLQAVDILCDLGNFAALPRPPGETAPQLAAAKRAFALGEIRAMIRQKIEQGRQKIEQAKIVAPDLSDLPQ